MDLAEFKGLGSFLGESGRRLGRIAHLDFKGLIKWCSLEIARLCLNGNQLSALLRLPSSNLPLRR